jgi:hypothetical protein
VFRSATERAIAPLVEEETTFKNIKIPWEDKEMVMQPNEARSQE